MDKQPKTGKYDDIAERNALVLLKRTLSIEEKRFLRLVCIDIESGEIVIVADNNGRPAEGLLSWNKDVDAVKEMQVIRAKFLTHSADLRDNRFAADYGVKKIPAANTAEAMDDMCLIV